MADAVLDSLADRVRDAAARKAPLDIRGGGTKAWYGEAPAGDPLDMTVISGISSYEPSELVVTVRAGTPLAELEAALAEQGQCLPFEPPRFGGAGTSKGTVGGMVAAGLAGPARASVGGVRDYVLGCTAMNGGRMSERFGTPFASLSFSSRTCNTQVRKSAAAVSVSPSDTVTSSR